MEGPDSTPILSPDKEPNHVEVKSNDVKSSEGEPSPIFNEIMEGVESSPFLGKRFLDKLKTNRDIQILLHELPQDATMEQIMSAYDKFYLDYLRSKAVVADAGIFERYEESTDGNPLSFRDRQSVVKMLVSPVNKFYKTKEGQEVNLAGYFNDYYKSLGISIKIIFETLPPGQIRGVERIFGMREEKFDPVHLYDDTVAVPVIEITKGEKTISVPLIGGDSDVTAPMRDPETREKLGSFIGLKIVHDTKYASSIQTNLGFLVHEFDHAVRKVLSDQRNWTDDLEDRIIYEGTAEMTRHRFSETQGKFEPRSGFDYQNSINFSSAAVGESEVSRIKDVKSTYASGLVLTERMRLFMGEDKFWETVYAGEQNLTEDQIKKLREKIVGELAKQKEDARQFLIS